MNAALIVHVVFMQQMCGAGHAYKSVFHIPDA